MHICAVLAENPPVFLAENPPDAKTLPLGCEGDPYH